MLRRMFSIRCMTYHRSPGTHIVGPWVIHIIHLYRDLRTGTQYIGNWASRVIFASAHAKVGLTNPSGFRV